MAVAWLLGEATGLVCRRSKVSTGKVAQVAYLAKGRRGRGWLPRRGNPARAAGPLLDWHQDQLLGRCWHGGGLCRGGGGGGRKLGSSRGREASGLVAGPTSSSSSSGDAQTSKASAPCLPAGPASSRGSAAGRRRASAAAPTIAWSCDGTKKGVVTVLLAIGDHPGA